MAVLQTDWLGLGGKVCAVTGGGSGIGREIALQLADAGAHVAVLDRNEASARQTADEIAKAGGKSAAFTCDVAQAANVTATAAACVRHFGRVDCLVNAAGILAAGNIERLALADWNKVLDVNLTSGFLCAQAFGQDMLRHRSGAIVHVASIAGSEPQAFSGAYSTSKAGLIMLSRQLAFEWGPQGIRNNVVSPGLVRTPLSESFYQVPGVLEKREAVIPVRRIAMPGDIASVVVFLLSPRSGYINGQDIVVDGGYSQTLMSHVPRPGHG